jgi:hypothetical protein
MIRWTAVLFITAAAWCQDARLTALHQTLATIHSKPPEPPPGAELTLAKHQIRDWIEEQLAQAKNLGEAMALSDRINAALKDVDASGPNDEGNLQGGVGDVHVSDEGGIVFVTTGIGVFNCQYDESVYGYKLMDGHWRRIWESEQTDYPKKRYAPQNVVAVHAWQDFQGGHEQGPAYVMTLSNSSGCTSNWHSVTYRVWRVDPSGSKLLIDDSEGAFHRMVPYAVGSIGRDSRIDSPIDVLIEFTQRSIDAGVHNREAIRRYLITGDQVRRVDPVALSPRDFVDEWLTRPWKDSASWSASAALRPWHAKLHSDLVAGNFDTTMHCQSPDLWQVTLNDDVFFLVRWRPPYHFTMMDIASKPWPRCTQKDPEADEWRTLFSTQDWRQ